MLSITTMGSLTKTEVMICNAAISLDFPGGLGDVAFFRKIFIFKFLFYEYM